MRIPCLSFHAAIQLTALEMFRLLIGGPKGAPKPLPID